MLAAIVVLFVTAADRQAQLLQLRITAGNIAVMRHHWRAELIALFTIKRVVVTAVLLHLIGNDHH